jgi:hypothetical protein
LALVDTAHVYSVWQFTPFAGLRAFSLLALTVAVKLLLNPYPSLKHYLISQNNFFRGLFSSHNSVESQ